MVQVVSPRYLWLPGNILATMSGSGSITAGESPAVSTSTSWVGIPDPASTLGYDPINATEPDDPPEWPGAEATGYYYIDSGHGSATDSGNTYGYPNQPRATIPTSLSIDGGKKCVVVGDGETYTGGTINVTSSDAATGEGNQAWFVGRSATDIEVKTNRPILSSRILNIGSDYIIASDFKLSHQDDNNTILGMTNFCTYRNFEVEGTGVESGFGSVISPPSNSCVLNGEIHEIGDWETDAAGDYHAIKSSGTVSNVWMLNILGYHIQGDTVQIGDAGGVAANVTNFYLGDVSGYENKENVIDLKDCTDIIISGGYGHDMDQVWGDDAGADVVVHDECNYAWIINREIYECSAGVIVAGDATNTFILNNIFRDFTKTGGSGFDAGEGHGVQARQGQVTISGNLFYNCRKGITLPSQSGAVQSISNNIFTNRAAVGSDNWDIGVQSTSDVSGTDWDFNIYESTRINYAGTVYTSLSSFQSATSHDDNSIEDTPTFTDDANDDYTSTASSPALAVANDTLLAAYSTFESRYGINIEKDFNNNDRPANPAEWDIGPYQSSTVYAFDGTSLDESEWVIYDNLGSASLSVSESGGRYVGDLNSNTDNGTLWYNTNTGLGHFRAISFPFRVIARNIGISPPGNPTGTHNPSGQPFNFCGVQVQNQTSSDTGTWDADDASAHVVIGHRGNSARSTVEGKNTINGSSSVDDEGAGAVTSSRGYIRIDGVVNSDSSRELIVYWKDSEGDSWTLYGGDGKLPGSEASWGANVYVGLITYAQDSTGIPFDGVCDEFEVKLIE